MPIASIEPSCPGIEESKTVLGRGERQAPSAYCLADEKSRAASVKRGERSAQLHLEERSNSLRPAERSAKLHPCERSTLQRPCGSSDKLRLGREAESMLYGVDLCVSSAPWSKKNAKVRPCERSAWEEVRSEQEERLGPRRRRVSRWRSA